MKQALFWLVILVVLGLAILITVPHVDRRGRPHKIYFHCYVNMTEMLEYIKTLTANDPTFRRESFDPNRVPEVSAARRPPLASGTPGLAASSVGPFLTCPERGVYRGNSESTLQCSVHGRMASMPAEINRLKAIYNSPTKKIARFIEDFVLGVRFVLDHL